LISTISSVDPVSSRKLSINYLNRFGLLDSTHTLYSVCSRFSVLSPD